MVQMEPFPVKELKKMGAVEMVPVGQILPPTAERLYKTLRGYRFVYEEWMAAVKRSAVQKTPSLHRLGDIIIYLPQDRNPTDWNPLIYAERDTHPERVFLCVLMLYSALYDVTGFPSIAPLWQAWAEQSRIGWL